MDHKLLPCPCCGSTDLNADKVSDTLVYCMGCGLRAINTERWNTRANRPADDAECDCGAEYVKDASPCREEHLPDCPARPTDDGLVAGNAGLRIGLMQARYMLRSESAKQDDPNYAAALCKGAEFCEQAATALRAQSDAEVEREAPTLANCTGADS